jgi:hypothetical protein
MVVASIVLAYYWPQYAEVSSGIEGRFLTSFLFYPVIAWVLKWMSMDLDWDCLTEEVTTSAQIMFGMSVAFTIVSYFGEVSPNVGTLMMFSGFLGYMACIRVISMTNRACTFIQDLRKWVF